MSRHDIPPTRRGETKLIRKSKNDLKGHLVSKIMTQPVSN